MIRPRECQTCLVTKAPKGFGFGHRTCRRCLKRFGLLHASERLRQARARRVA